MDLMEARFAPPPRRVPWSLQVVNTVNAGSQIGWAVVAFASIFFWAFVADADLSFLNFRGPFGHTDGRVLGIERTSASENKQRVMASRYEYSVAGEWFRGVSYSTGDPDFAVGDKVPVEYAQDDPKESRIAGLRRKIFGPGVLFVLIFPLVGLAIALGMMVYGARRNRLLRDGVLTTGVLTNRAPTNVTVNKRTVYALTFSFTDSMGMKRETVARSSTPEKLTDEQQEPLLYDPVDPSRAYLLDDAPARPRVDENGELQGRFVAAIASLILPLLTIGGNVAFVLFRMGKIGARW